MSTTTEAAESAQAAAPQKQSYSGAPLNPAPYTVSQPDGTTLRVHNFGDRLSQHMECRCAHHVVAIIKAFFNHLICPVVPSNQRRRGMNTSAPYS